MLVLADRLHCLIENDVSAVSLNTAKVPVFAVVSQATVFREIFVSKRPGLDFRHLTSKPEIKA